MSQQFDYHILFDGGSRGNGTATQEGYGSYLIVNARGQRQPVQRREFGNVTCNEAEYRTLLSALADLLRTIEDAGKDTTEFDVRIVGDSQAFPPFWQHLYALLLVFAGKLGDNLKTGKALVLNQVSGDWKCKKQHLIPLRDQAQTLVARFHSVTFEHTPRETCVRLLGH